MKKFKVIFCGTPDFSVPALELLHSHPAISLVSVVTMPDRPAGRGKQLQSPPVAMFAKENKIPLIQTDDLNKDASLLNHLGSGDIDFIVVLAFAQFLGSKVLKSPKQGCFNIHTSLLPMYRGAAPIQYALLNGDQETGVSIQKMVKKMDAGNIVHEHAVSIEDNETGGQLYTRLKYQAALALNDFIIKLQSNSVTEKEQDEEFVSFAPTLKRENGHLKFSEKNFESIFNQVRALLPWPGTYCFLNKKRMKVFAIEEYDKKLNPGEVYTKDGFLVIGTKDKSIRVTELQLEGKKRCTDIELLNGLRNEIEIG